jgi:septum formation protein
LVVLVLASRSPQRRAILEQLGIEFEVVVPDVEELTEGEPEGVVVENALRKARAVPGDLVLGVDTEVVLGDRVYGKPADAADARGMLGELAGRDHDVWSGIALVAGERERSASVRTAVRFRDLTDAELDWYVATGEWKDRAGGYAIQARGAALVEGLAGDYNNVVGLPVAALLDLAPELLS